MRSLKGLFFITLALASLGQVMADLYLPSLPAIRHGLQASVNATQFSVALYMVGFSVSQLFYGPISDGVGRRKPLIIGLVLCLMGSAICLTSQSISALISGRFLQGLGAGAGLTLARAILRDVFDGTALARFASYLALGNVTLMASAPLLGGYFQHFFGWRANFAFLSAYALVALSCVIFLLPETNQHRHRDHLKWRNIKRNAAMLLTNPVFMGYAGCVFFAYAGILAWLTEGPILLEEGMGLTPVGFGWLALAAGVTFFIGSLINSQVVSRFGMIGMTTLGESIMLFGGLAMLAVVLCGVISTTAIIVPIFIFMFGSSFVFPNAFAGAFTPFPKIAGFAGAVFGFIQILGGALASSLVSLLHTQTQLPLAVILITAALLPLLFVRCVMRPAALSA